MIREAIHKIVDKQDLSYTEAYTVMNEIMAGKTSQVENAAYLAALSTKSAKAETIDEIAGSAAAMREHALRVHHEGFEVVEIVGTGGDGAQSINVSTTAAFIAAAAGVAIAKHGNRSASSRSGAADCLEALGANIRLAPAQAEELLRRIGFCFMFAQEYHASMRYVGAIRKELGIRTVFNILGPLTNPAHPDAILLGVYDAYLVEPLTKALITLGVKRGLVVYGQDGFDEISISDRTLVSEFRDGWYRSFTIAPEDFNLPRANKKDITGGTPVENAAITRAILSGQEKGAKTDMVLLNAGAAIYLGQKAKTIGEGVNIARQMIVEGKALAKLESFIKASHKA